MRTRKISNPNHLVVYFIQDRLESIKGSSGLFLAAVFCGSLSSVSSTLNSMTSIVWHDFLKRLPPPRFRTQQTFLRNDEMTSLKLIVITLGALSSTFALLIANFGSNLSQISTSLKGAFTAPVFGLFVLACFFSIIDKMGAFLGALAGFLFGIFISFGAYVTKPIYSGAKLATSVSGCSFDSGGEFVGNSSSAAIDNATEAGIVFRRVFYLSYMWYTTAGAVITVCVALIVSLVRNLVLKRSNLNRALYSSSDFMLFDVCSCFYKKQKQQQLQMEGVNNKTFSTEEAVHF